MGPGVRYSAIMCTGVYIRKKRGVCVCVEGTEKVHGASLGGSSVVNVHVSSDRAKREKRWKKLPSG